MRTRTPNHLMYLIPVAVILLIFLANPFITATMDSGEGPGPDEGEGTAPVESVEPTDPRSTSRTSSQENGFMKA